MSLPGAVVTLGQFIISRQSDYPYAKGELSRLLRDSDSPWGFRAIAGLWAGWGNRSGLTPGRSKP